MAPAVVKEEVAVPATKMQAATPVRRKGATPQQQKPRGLAEGIRTLRNSATLCDVLLVVGEEAFPAHQAMLSAMSPAFGVYLREAQPEPQPDGSKDTTSKEGASPPVLSRVIDSAPSADASAGSPTLTVSPPPTLPPTGPPPLAEETQASSYEAIARAALNVTESSTEAKPAATTATEDVATGTAVVEEQAVVAAAVAEAEAEKQVKLRVHGISHPESLKIMLDYLYQVGTGCAWEYSPSNLEVNKEVLQLARQFELKHLSEHAARWLTKGLTTKNLVQRLVICEEFKLGALREKLIEQLTANPAELSVVCRSAEVLAHPTILQDLLVQVSALCGMATAPQKRSAPEETEEKASEEPVKEEKVEKVEKVEKAEKAEKVEKAEKAEKASEKVSSKVASKENVPEKVKAEKEQPEKVSVKTSSKMQPLKKKRTA